MTTETNNGDELMQEPLPLPELTVERLWREGRLGSNDKLSWARMTAGTRLFEDWWYSKFNPLYASARSGNIPDDVLTHEDKYLRAFRRISPEMRNIADSFLIRNQTIDGFFERNPILNNTAQTKREIVRALIRALDQIGQAYEDMDNLTNGR